ncbi:hypothetical protein IGJ55_001228 [Enterococcus sp. AZ170]|uniref:hypothetical protein n=1 Tax=unclassified Enterococcus TaxID=2608891 RepID=UPI003D274AFE
MIKCKPAFVIGILFTVNSIYRFLNGSLTSPTDPFAYNIGTVLSAILFPMLFFIIAFLQKKK